MTKKKDPAAVKLGRKGGKVGGKAKVPKGFSMMTPERRKAIAREGVKARWGREQ
jgi:hypothetical protein